jgi:predicted AAA+ superfamily ATPase
VKRTIYAKLIQWKNASGRKPLILKGARQTGKTYSLKEFCQKEFSRLHYVNFQRNKSACRIFSGSLSPAHILESLEFHLDTRIDRKEDVVFFDEIQDCPRALTSLKYFNEDMDELAVVCAGSLLGVTRIDEPFPVGKVTFLNLFPMSFEEFLAAVDDRKSCDFLDGLRFPDTIPEVIHSHLTDKLKEYFVVGGLPEVVKTYSSNQKNKHEAFLQAREKQEALLTAYMSDFSKYSGKVNANDISNIFQSIPAQLARENKKFKASEALPGGRFDRLKSPIDWLVSAGLLIQVRVANSGEIPFAAFTKDNRFKLYIFDIGILGALAKIPLVSIYLKSNLFSTFRGAFCENYVAQEFTYAGSGQLYSWMSNTAEVEFLREVEGEVYPIEVKAGHSGKLKSLNVFARKYKTGYRIRISARNLEFNEQAGMHSYPLYLAHKFPLN